jgi:hypothetical protein
MKLTAILSLLALLNSSPAIFAADAPAPAAPDKPELHGVLATATEKRFSLSVGVGGRSEWVSLGDKFGDWKLADFKDADGTLVLRKDNGTELDLNLGSSHINPEDAKATVADAQAILEKMQFAKVAVAALAPQRKMLLGLLPKLAQRAGLSPSSPGYADFQQKAAALINAALDPKQMEDDVAKIYSNVFTRDELNGLGDFFDSPIGQVYTEKSPEVQKQMQAAVFPRIMGLMPQIQALAQPAKPATSVAAPAAAPK